MITVVNIIVYHNNIPLYITVSLQLSSVMHPPIHVRWQHYSSGRSKFPAIVHYLLQSASESAVHH